MSGHDQSTSDPETLRRRAHLVRGAVSRNRRNGRRRRSEGTRKVRHHYITPLKKDGAESSCHAEVWFTYHGSEIYVVTASNAWRARAVSLGLNQARMWVGEFGEWKDSKEAYRKAPELTATSALVTDAAVQSQVLDSFGKKYYVQWVGWGPKFRNGLKDGSRVMLRYTPTA